VEGRITDYEDAVVRIAVQMARERGIRGGQFYRYTPEEIMALIPMLREAGELWSSWTTGHRELDKHTIRCGYVISGGEPAGWRVA
jgi:hypothetical protein